MKLIIERAALYKSLSHVQSIVERRNTIPILSNVLLNSDGDSLGLTATDMDISIVEAVGATIETPGTTSAPAHTLYDIVRKLPDGVQIELDTTCGDNGQMSLRSDRSVFKLQTLPAEDYPKVDDGEFPFKFAIGAGELCALIDRTRFAISTEETRYYLNGIFIHTTKIDDKEVMRTVATDGHRLARVEMSLPEGATGMPGVIVPRKTVNELRKLIDEVSDDIDVALSDTSIRFSFGNSILTSKLIDGTFPDYERVIPTANDKSLNVDCRSFANAVDRVATISTEKSRAVKLTAAENNLILTASSPDSGTAREEIEVKYNSTAIEIGFNARYLLDIAQQIEGDEAEFIVADSASPTIVRDSKDDSALYVLMPMRV